MKKINQTGSRPELSRGGASYATKVLQRVAGKGEKEWQTVSVRAAFDSEGESEREGEGEGLAPIAPSVSRQAMNAQDLRQQLHRIAERSGTHYSNPTMSPVKVTAEGLCCSQCPLSNALPHPPFPGPNLLQPGPKSPQRQQAGNSQDLRQQLHRVAERGRAATQSNSYRLMMAVAQAKEQEEEKVRDKGEG